MTSVAEPMTCLNKYLAIKRRVPLVDFCTRSGKIIKTQKSKTVSHWCAKTLLLWPLKTVFLPRLLSYYYSYCAQFIFSTETELEPISFELHYRHDIICIFEITKYNFKYESYNNVANSNIMCLCHKSIEDLNKT
ncbi:LOW QUALITY PROTEIN: hypothetical protein KUTeg_008118 [Tegillarca granosa]|uniref:Uncharacterized protein n=1 Tax=Tegillarca granosa TaxID=220873 RepID=A0ABQ9FCH9_TEGGR|nr:LOW QUALITY PROTEIN: hypothetical protein KUTeg_008118 [Tegillarca granosa]